MVRVISVHHFNSQDVSSVSQPCASTSAGENLLLVATESLVVEVRDLTKNVKLSHSFQTIDQVSEILYSPVGNYVATLEGVKGKEGSSVRVYVNWDNPNVDGAQLRPRIASRVTPSLMSHEITLDMIEFPQRDSPVQIGVCPSTGNLVVAAANVMVIYKYVLKTQETSKAKYIDFEDSVQIFHNFLPKEISLVESVVACLSDTEIHVFRLKLIQSNDDERNLRSFSVYSFSSETDSLQTEHGYGHHNTRLSSDESTVDTDQNRITHPTIKTNVTAKKQQDSEGNDCHLEGYGGNIRYHSQHVSFGNGDDVKRIVLSDIEKSDREYFAVGPPKIMDHLLGPCSPSGGFRGSGGEIIVKIAPSTDQEQSVEAEAITLVHCKLLPEEEHHEMFQNLILKPVYWKEMRVRKQDDAFHALKNGLQQHPLHSVFHPHLMAITLCFTSINEGYLYHLPGHIRKPGKGLGVQRIATYPFTSPVSKISMEPTLLHALTQTGLETYTLRSGYSTVLEAETIDERTNACPSSETPICLVGLRPFLGAKQLELTKNYLVLLAADESNFSGQKNSDSDDSLVESKQWTVYSLQLPTPLTLYKDMTELANLNRALSPQGFMQLLCEAHVVLRTAQHQLAWQLALSPSPVTEEELFLTKEKYYESCLTLGNYYLLSEEPSEWKQALAYFRMSQQPVLKILFQAKESWMKKVEESGASLQGATLPPGLINYIEEVILSPVPGEDLQQASLADLIIEMLGEFSPETLAEVVLKSAPFREFKASKMYAYLKDYVDRRPRPGANEVVAFALLCVSRGTAEEARLPLQALPPIQLSDIVLQYYEFLLDASGGSEPTFSEFAAILRDTVPETFVEILVSLIKANVFSLSVILQLFIESFVSMSSNGSSDLTVHHASTLQLFLEAYFTETLTEPSTELDSDEVRALHTLIRSYLTSLSVPVRFGERHIDSNMFGQRPLFLDQLPPFSSPNDPADKVILNTDSPEFWCQNSLLKLQSLLVSALCRESKTSTAMSADCKEIIFNFLSMKEDTIGSLSLRLICSLDDTKESINLLVENHPEVLLAFGKEEKLNLEGWKAILTSLQEQVSERPGDHHLHEVWYSSLQEVLEHLATTLMLEAFMEVLPGPQHNEDYLAYIQLCRKTGQAHKIQKLIVTTGNELLNKLQFS